MPSNNSLIAEPSAELIAALRESDPDAQLAIYREYATLIYTVIRRLIGRPAIADELFQEVFVDILRGIAGYSGAGSFGGWIRSIAVNRCMMYLRSPWHRGVLWLDALHGGNSHDSDMVERSRADTPQLDATLNARADLERAFGALPALTRAVVWLHDVEEYTHKEIAQLLHRTPSFSKSQLMRGHARLRQLLDAEIAPTACASTPVVSKS